MIGPLPPPGPVGAYSRREKDNRKSISHLLHKYFVEQNGDKLIIERIKDTENPIPTKLVFALLPIGSMIADYFRFVDDKLESKEAYILEMFSSLEEYVRAD